MKTEIVRPQIEKLEPHKLGYLAGILSVHLGIHRTIKAVDVINSTSAGGDQTEYFKNLICLMAIELREMDWDRSLRVLRRVLA